MQNIDFLSELHTVTSFLNSLFLEWKKFEVIENKIIVISYLNERILIPLKTFSLIGRHHYTGKFFIEKSGERLLLSFDKFIEKITILLSEELLISKEETKAFLERLKNSQENIQVALTHRQNDLSDISQNTLNFKKAEQALFAGHTFHPTPKSRGEFSDTDYLTFSAEMAGKFPLEWYLVSQDIFYTRSSESFKDHDWAKNLFLNEFKNREEAQKKLKTGFTPIPIHSWQKKHILNNSDIHHYIREGKIINLGPSDKEWFPTSSLRTLYAPHASYMVKFSLNVRLTNSIRNLFVHELERGLQIHDVFNSEHGKDFQNAYPEFEVIHEPLYGAILNKAGAPIQESLFMLRENPFQAETQSLVLATLTQDHVSFETNLLGYFIQEFSNRNAIDLKLSALIWFKSFFHVAVRPLIMAQANWGILLGAHQQNMIVEIKNNLPVKSYFRDCHGTGYSSLGEKLFSNIESITPTNGNIFNSQVGNYLFGYYLVINSIFNVISSIAHSRIITEKELLAEFRISLLNLKELNLKDSSFIDYLLNAPELFHKGNFLCSLRGINENTAQDPLNIYTKIPNPIREGSLL